MIHFVFFIFLNFIGLLLEVIVFYIMAVTDYVYRGLPIRIAAAETQ